MRIFLIVILFTVYGCMNAPNGFVITGDIKGEYTNDLFLYYNDKIDTVNIVDGKFKFKGKVEEPTLASLYTVGICSNDKEFYIENNNMIVNVSYKKKKIKDTNINWIIIDTVIGSKTSNIKYDFDKFYKKYNSTTPKNKKHLYNRVLKLIEKNSDNKYMGVLLTEICRDSVLGVKDLRYLYSKLEKNALTKINSITIEKTIFPERQLSKGKIIPNFKLANVDNKIVNLDDYRGKVVLLEFWASWCGPCRKKFPKIKRIRDKFINKNFEIVGVSLDTNKKKWLKAIEQDHLSFENLNDSTSFDSPIAKAFGILEIPYNILINEEGKIIAKDISIQKLEIILNNLN